MSLNEVVLERIVLTPAHEAVATRVLVLPHGGMGDRVAFQVLVRHALEEHREARVVVAVPFQADEYNARHYVPAPDEVWTLRKPPIQGGVFQEVHAAACRLFGSQGPVTTTFYGPRNAAPPSFAGGQWVEPYPLIAKLARDCSIYPTFRIGERARRLVQEELARARIDLATHRLLAVHCRARPGEATKNPDPSALTMIAGALRRLEGVRLLVLGAEDVPPALREIADVLDVGQPDLSLQRLAAFLERCSVLLCGDSGPMHLAAAVGTPVVALVAEEREECWGPFAPSARCSRVDGFRDPQTATLSFRPDEVIGLVRPWLSS